MGKGRLIIVGGVVKLLTPVEHTDHDVGTLCPQFLDALDSFVFVRQQIVAGSPDPEPETVLRCYQLALILIPVGEACFIQNSLCAFNTFLIKVQRVVVAHRYKVNAAICEDVYICCLREEGKCSCRVVVCKLFIRERAFQICKCILVLREKLYRITVWIAVIVTHGQRQADRIVQEIGRSPECVVPDEGELEVFRLRFRSGFRSRFRGGSRRSSRLRGAHNRFERGLFHNGALRRCKVSLD